MPSSLTTTLASSSIGVNTKSSSRLLVVLAVAAASVLNSSVVDAAAASSVPVVTARTRSNSGIHSGSTVAGTAAAAAADRLFLLRGGATSTSETKGPPTSTKRKSKSKRSKSKSKIKSKVAATAAGKSKEIIEEAMMEKDAAEALGDAIRDRADILRNEDPFLQSIDWSVGSVGQALGASDAIRREGGGVQASQSSVIAHYFLKSHGGAHALQCVCSFLATVSGMGAIALNGNTKLTGLCYTMLQRTFLFAMLKHLSGLLAAASIAAKAVPKIGLGQARQWMEQLVLDPVSQYVFFSALLLVWLPSKARVIAGNCWWWSHSKTRWMIPVLVGPILIREYISNLLVISDVMVLWSVTQTDASGIERVLAVSQSVINAVMSLLVTPSAWREADAAQRQAILSKLVGRVSLVLEVIIGAVLVVDSALALFGAAFGGAFRPLFVESFTRLICIRLYVHFLWVRKTQIRQLAVQVRGGAAQFPFQVLDVLYEPMKSLGLDSEFTTTTTTSQSIADSAETNDQASTTTKMSWKDYVVVGLGLDQ